MAVARSQFIGAAGQYYLSYALAARNINASLTLGNAPSVDVIVSSGDGKRSMAIQVKTATSARKKRYGNVGYEWYVGSGAIGKFGESFLYAFLDFKGDLTSQPDVFFVPSQWVGRFVKPGWSMYLYFLPATPGMKITKNRWNLLEGYLSGDLAAIEWANCWPKTELIEWGTPSDITEPSEKA